MNGFSDLVFTGRSIRKFQERDIPLSDIKAAIKAAAGAPSGDNSQCWNFIINCGGSSIKYKLSNLEK